MITTHFLCLIILYLIHFNNELHSFVLIIYQTGTGVSVTAAGTGVSVTAACTGVSVTAACTGDCVSVAGTGVTVTNYSTCSRYQYY